MPKKNPIYVSGDDKELKPSSVDLKTHPSVRKHHDLLSACCMEVEIFNEEDHEKKPSPNEKHHESTSSNNYEEVEINLTSNLNDEINFKTLTTVLPNDFVKIRNE